SSPQILSMNELQELSNEIFSLSTEREIVLNADLKMHAVNFPPHSFQLIAFHLREIFHVLDLMKMDVLNFTIQSLHPYLQEHHIQYEREKFQKILDKLPSKFGG
ncbi:hypothetical protein ASZ78_000402, partial [Callipepla squamata]